MNYQFDAFMTIVAAVAVLLVGYVCVNKVSILKNITFPNLLQVGWLQLLLLIFCLKVQT